MAKSDSSGGREEKDRLLFDGIAEVALVPASEAYGANVVAVGSSVLVAEGHPHVERAFCHPQYQGGDNKQPQPGYQRN